LISSSPHMTSSLKTPSMFITFRGGRRLKVDPPEGPEQEISLDIIKSTHDIKSSQQFLDNSDNGVGEENSNFEAARGHGIRTQSFLLYQGSVLLIAVA
jgi:hypothetical protein